MQHFSFNCFTKSSCSGLYVIHHSQAIVIWLSCCTYTINFLLFGVNHSCRKVSYSPIILWFESLWCPYERSSELCSALHAMCWSFLQLWGRSKSPAQLVEKPEGTFLCTSAGLYSSWRQTRIIGLTQPAKGGLPGLAPMYYRGGNYMHVGVQVKAATHSSLRTLPSLLLLGWQSHSNRWV